MVKNILAILICNLILAIGPHHREPLKPKFQAIIINRTAKSLLIKTEILNTGNDTVNYLSLSCGWDEVYKIESKEWKIRTVICQHNIPVEVAIPPHKSVIKFIKLIRNKIILKDNGALKIGFSFVASDGKLGPDVNQYLLLDNNKNVIWSKVY